ncbi:hypothetical protein Pcinc_011855 [Petrolisthes cinctipes]|uniref:Structure-specific endonuclease subunit SLX1 homolog n=1 Tax=Petrolisthes cinctipes TaxID=88211 RepID=A0AAE1KT32_PETCI|nr:hypothetical protein Pcinc_011855 [Petrolisthes cinctipes]
MGDGGDVDLVEDFYGVYLLYSTNPNPRYRGRTYIGYTVDPNRRIKQHNRGTKAGGAYKTSNKGPWVMVLIVHGFPNDISALRFEWAWQHPEKSRRLREVGKKKSSELRYNFSLRVLSHMLRTRPWSRLPLTIRWLQQEYMREFPPGLEPPVHMPVAYGPVKPTRVKTDVSQDADDVEVEEICVICQDSIKKTDIMRCLSPSCVLVAHVICLAKRLLDSESGSGVMLLPLEGECPSCSITLLWGDLVRQKRGCYQHQHQSEGDNHWADTLSQAT